MEKLYDQFKNYEVSARGGVYSVEVYDKELDEIFMVSAQTLNEAIELLMTKVQVKKQELKQSIMVLTEHKQKLMELNKGPLIYEILDQICMESDPPQYCTTAALTMADGTTVKGSISSWSEREIENKMYNLMYEKVFPH